MENSCTVELDRHYFHNRDNDEEEIYTSDDSEVRVANMNKSSENEIFEEEIDDEHSYIINNDEDVIVSDDEYTYSEDSVCSEQYSCRDSDVTNVTPRSSLSAGSPLNRTMSLDLPIGALDDITRVDESNTYSRRILENPRENVRRICSSVNDNRYVITNEPHSESSRSRRRNMSFTNAEMRRIELENQYLLKKIMAQQKPQNKSMRAQSAQPKVSSSAINRKKLQKRIEADNMMLLRRIQEAKSCAVPSNVIPGYRLTSL